MLLAFIIAGLVIAALFGLSWWWATREELPPFDCSECGLQDQHGPRCRVTDIDEDPMTGEGFAMVADFHPDCCPVIDPAHEHAS